MEKQNVYDNEQFYSEYIAMRETHVNANDLLEIPVMKELMPDLKGKTVLDLGCGYGEMSKFFIEQGAIRVVACDISENMIKLAQMHNADDRIEYKILSMEELSLINEKFDFVFSSLAFHYVEDYNKLINDIYNHLNTNGILLFSQEHPIVTAPTYPSGQDKRIDLKDKRYFIFSDYNVEGARTKLWNNTDVVKYHRNFKTTINTIINNNLELLAIEESTARPEAVEKVAKYIYQNDRPYFLFVKARKNK